MDPTLSVLILFLAGMVMSALGAMTGLGGGFLAVPFMIFVWGEGLAASVLLSLTMILANSISSSVFYLRNRMVDVKMALWLIVPAVPGLFAGYLLLKNLSPRPFYLMFAALLFCVTTYILISRTRKKGGEGAENGIPHPREGWRRLLVTAPFSFLAGTASSAFGIGGGAIFMPLQVTLLKKNVKKAIATTMMVLAMMTLFRVFVISGADVDLLTAIPLATGAVLGAQLGAMMVRRIKGRYLFYLLIAFLFMVAFYTALRGLGVVL
jgi:hypothetical protein